MSQHIFVSDHLGNWSVFRINAIHQFRMLSWDDAGGMCLLLYSHLPTVQQKVVVLKRHHLL